MVLFNMTNTALIHEYKKVNFYSSRHSFEICWLLRSYKFFFFLNLLNISKTTPVRPLYRKRATSLETSMPLENLLQLNRKRRLHWKWYLHLQSVLLNLCFIGKISCINI